MIFWFALIPVIIIAARLAARYLAGRETTASSASPGDDLSLDYSVSTSAPEKEAEMLRQQVISKIHWGARDEEVYEWLQGSHGITGREADELLAQAHRAKRKAVRVKASIMLVISGCGLLAAGGFLALYLRSHILLLGRTIIFIACVSLFFFLRSLWQLLTGQMKGSVD